MKQSDKKNYKLVQEIIRLYTDTELSSEMEREVKIWLSNESYTEEKEAALWNIWNNLPDVSRRGTKEAWKEMKKKMGVKDTSVVYLNRKRFLQAAAIFIPLALFIGVVYINFKGPINVEEQIMYVEQLIFKSDNEVTTITLPDDTEVWLNKQSELIHSENRQVTLKGEAIFNVKHIENQKFIVRSEHFTATVTGTRFNIKVYPESDIHLITLYEGSLEVEINDTLVVMVPGEELIFNRELVELVKDTTFKTMPEWNRNYISYNETELQEIFKDLEKRYSIEIKEVNRSILRDTVTLKLEGEPDIREVISLLSEINGKFKYKIEEDIIYIY